MINHCRSLLLNASGDVAPDPKSYPGEELVPESFRSAVLPGPEGRVWDALFGSSPDRAFLNYRLRRLLPAAHEGPLGEALLTPDRRVTYWPVRDAIADFDRWSRYGTVVVTPNTSPRPTVIGTLSSEDKSGRCYSQWKVSLAVDLAVTVDRLDVPSSSGPGPLAFSGGLSAPVDLPGTGVSLLLPESAGSWWYVDALARPEVSSADVYSRAAACAQGDLSAVFNLADADLGRSCRALWKNGEFAGERLGGLVIALARRLDDLRRP